MTKDLREDLGDEDLTDFEQGFMACRRYIADVMKKGREGIDSEGDVYDLIELAAVGHVPDDVIAQIEARVPPKARPDFELGFLTCAQEWVAGQHLGMSEN